MFTSFASRGLARNVSEVGNIRIGMSSTVRALAEGLLATVVIMAALMMEVNCSSVNTKTSSAFLVSAAYPVREIGVYWPSVGLSELHTSSRPCPGSRMTAIKRASRLW